MSRSRLASPRRLLLTLLAAPVAAAGAQQGPQVPFVPTPHPVVRAMLDVARVDSTDIVYDLGSGDGRIVIAAASRHGALGLGVEIDEDLVALARRNAQRARVSDRVSFRAEDLFDLDLSPATVVTLYLLSDVNLRLRPRLLEQLRPGSRVVSHAFNMGDWEPDSTLWVPHDGLHARVFYWVIPAAVAGAWRFEIDGLEPVTIELAQRFQRVHATSTGSGRGSREISIQGRLRGEEIELSLSRAASGATQLTGRLTAQGMAGTIAGSTLRWTARLVQE